MSRAVSLINRIISAITAASGHTAISPDPDGRWFSVPEGGVTSQFMDYKSGTYAARPAASAVNAGMIYIATDIGIAPGCLFRSTGSAWQQVGDCVLYIATASLTRTAPQANITIIPSGIGTLTIPANAAAAGCQVEIYTYGKSTNTAGALNTLLTAKLGTTVVATCPGLVDNVVQADYLRCSKTTLTFQTIGASADIASVIEEAWFYVAGRGWILQSAIAVDPTANTVDSTTALVIDLMSPTNGTAGDTTTVQQMKVVVRGLQ